MRKPALSTSLLLTTATMALAKDPVRIGGRDAQIIVVDDEGKPDITAQKAHEPVESLGVDFVIGPIFSDVMTAIAAPVTSAGGILVSPNAGPSSFAGAGCNPDIFVVSYQNDQMPQVLAEHMNREGIETAYLLAPNYQAGQDSLNGFKSVFGGQVLGELYVPLGQLDFSGELAQIAAAVPQAVYTFMPGGMGVNLVGQWSQAGVSGIPMMSAFPKPARQFQLFVQQLPGAGFLSDAGDQG